MNNILKISIIWILASIVIIKIVPNSQNTYLIGWIGIVLFWIGIAINEYQFYKFERDFL